MKKVRFSLDVKEPKTTQYCKSCGHVNISPHLRYVGFCEICLNLNCYHCQDIYGDNICLNCKFKQ